MSNILDCKIKRAKWITAPSSIAAPVIGRQFVLDRPKECKIAVSALGFFTAYVNGVRIGNEYFRPSNSIFRERNCQTMLYPISDEFTYRCYYSVYDKTEYVHDGDNLLEIALGDGWYRQTDRTAEGDVSFGDALGTIFEIFVSDMNGVHTVYSDGSEWCRSSAILYSQLFYGERYDARIERDGNYTYSGVTVTELPDTILTEEDSVPDREIRRIKPKMVYSDGDTVIYDACENISGFAVITASPADGEEIRIRYSENINNNNLDFETTGSQYINPQGVPQIMEDVFIGDGASHEFSPKFVWHSFRYFEIKGNIDLVYVAVIHSDTDVIAEFESSSDELNRLFDAYLRTQLDNMHCGVPSDCPHRERLGYTGDGQACAPAAMLMLDCKAFYRKWIRDIFDSQDKVGGHVNHTAPFAGGGGGPGGWGNAAITVPYNYYKQFGDKKPLEQYYNNMKRWIDYLASRSENGLVVREEDGGWCLGDWATLDPTVIPEPFVNTCLFIRALMYMKEISAIIGNTQDNDRFDALRAAAEQSIYDRYYNKETSSFADGVQGADAFAIYAGLGNEKTLENLIEKYAKLGHFDTGFLCTPILVQLLFDNGGDDVAYKLLTSHEPGGFGYMFDNNATTIWEYWRGWGSHNHPMFGASAKNLITSVLGISQKDTSAAYTDMVIAPHTPHDMTYAKGGVKTPHGKVEVKWHRDGTKIKFEIKLPENFSCDFEYGDIRRRLDRSLNIFSENSL